MTSKISHFHLRKHKGLLFCVPSAGPCGQVSEVKRNPDVHIYREKITDANRTATGLPSAGRCHRLPLPLRGFHYPWGAPFLAFGCSLLPAPSAWALPRAYWTPQDRRTLSHTSSQRAASCKSPGDACPVQKGVSTLPHFCLPHTRTQVLLELENEGPRGAPAP